MENTNSAGSGVTVFDVAKYILSKTGSISTWKLQKLCYYSQAWSLAWYNKPLFNEDFQAWSNGPVCRELFNVHKHKYFIVSSDIDGNEKKIIGKEKSSIDKIIRYYGDKDAYWLREQTHSEEPWKRARAGIPDGQPSERVISKEMMGAYYGSL